MRCDHWDKKSHCTFFFVAGTDMTEPYPCDGKDRECLAFNEPCHKDIRRGLVDKDYLDD